MTLPKSTKYRFRCYPSDAFTRARNAKKIKNLRRSPDLLVDWLGDTQTYPTPRLFRHHATAPSAHVPETKSAPTYVLWGLSQQ